MWVIEPLLKSRTTGNQAESSVISRAAKSEEQEVSFLGGRGGGGVCVHVWTADSAEKGPNLLIHITVGQRGSSR